MKITNLFLTLTFFFLIIVSGGGVSGCASSQPGEEGKRLARTFDGESVQVFVAGRERGFTPMTLRVRRSRGEYEVALKKGKELVRQYELGVEGSSNTSPEGQALYMDLSRDNAVMGLRTFDLDDLESRNDTLYFIPFYNSDLSIDDVQYGLTLIITD